MFSCRVLLQKERSLSSQLPLPGCTVITLSTGILSSPLAGSQHCRRLSLTLFCSFTSEHQLVFLTRLLGDLGVNAALGKSDCLAEMALRLVGFYLPRDFSPRLFLCFYFHFAKSFLYFCFLFGPTFISICRGSCSFKCQTPLATRP